MTDRRENVTRERVLKNFVPDEILHGPMRSKEPAFMEDTTGLELGGIEGNPG
jgi:hypothetical protein